MKTLPENIVKSLGLVLTNLTMYDSFVQDCVFYQTRYKELYLTNYDVARQTACGEASLSDKGVWCLYYRASRMAHTYISLELLLDAALFNNLLDHLYKNMTRQTVMGLEIHKN